MPEGFGRGLNRVIDAVVEDERELDRSFHAYGPLVETYLETVAECGAQNRARAGLLVPRRTPLDAAGAPGETRTR